jgi:hypothetical protein
MVAMRSSGTAAFGERRSKPLQAAAPQASPSRLAAIAAANRETPIKIEAAVDRSIDLTVRQGKPCLRHLNGFSSCLARLEVLTLLT